jgi:peptidoglycan/LPS O-acetylase OafA/YrhL
MQPHGSGEDILPRRPSGDSATRRIGFDYLRGFVIVMVVLYHTMMAYCTFGHFNPQHYMWSSAPIVDAQRWRGFDIAVLLNDSYFMPLMFLLSGLFVRPSLERKGARAYLLDRLRRLGVPFVLTVLTIMPLAFYASYRMTGAGTGFGAFWAQTVTEGPWPAGPPWFIAVLFGFDVVAAATLSLCRRLDRAGPDTGGPDAGGPDAGGLEAGRLDAGRLDAGRLDTGRGGISFGLLSAVTLATLLPLLLRFGPHLWFSYGPFSIQASRMLLYPAYFLVGIAAGPNLRIHGRRPVLLAVALFLPLLGEQIGELRVPGLLSPVGWLVLYGVTLALFCAAATRALLSAFARLRVRSAICDSLSANAYGIYLVHYVFVLWGQYALVDTRIGAIPKAAAVFIAALALSWGSSAAVRALLPPRPALLPPRPALLPPRLALLPPRLALLPPRLAATPSAVGHERR